MVQKKKNCPGVEEITKKMKFFFLCSGFIFQLFNAKFAFQVFSFAVHPQSFPEPLYLFAALTFSGLSAPFGCCVPPVLNSQISGFFLLFFLPEKHLLFLPAEQGGTGIFLWALSLYTEGSVRIPVIFLGFFREIQPPLGFYISAGMSSDPLSHRGVCVGIDGGATINLFGL